MVVKEFIFRLEGILDYWNQKGDLRTVLHSMNFNGVKDREFPIRHADTVR